MADIKRAPKTVSSTTSVETRRLSLIKRIKTFRDIQRIYMPEVCHLLTREDECETPSHPETIKLFLPSQAPVDIRVRDRVRNCENLLRVGQAYDALSNLRSSLCIRAHLGNYKHTVRGQHMNTRMNALMESADRKSASIAAKYRAARQALVSLMGADKIDPQLKELKDSDVRTMSDPEILNNKHDKYTGDLGEGSRVVSWIWTSVGGGGDAEMHKGAVLY
jgi:hypothetical protein